MKEIMLYIEKYLKEHVKGLVEVYYNCFQNDIVITISTVEMKWRYLLSVNDIISNINKKLPNICVDIIQKYKIDIIDYYLK